MRVANRPASGTGILLLVAVVFVLVGCASKQVSSPPTTPQDATYEQGTPDPEQSAQQSEGGGGEQGGEQSGEQTGEQAGEQAGPPPGSQTPGEHQSGLDRQLEESLREFEDRMRREQEALADQAAGSGESGQPAGDDAAVGGGTSSGSGTGEGASPDQPGGGGSSPSGASNPGHTPSDIPDGSDDDIVARQLREMAEAEEDPELRAIYWQEYVDYKSGKRTQRKQEESGGKDENEGS